MEDDGIDGVEDFDDLDVFGPATAVLCYRNARQAGDDAVDGLDKITAQMSGGEHRPEQQEMCRAVAEAIAHSCRTSSSRPGRERASRSPTWSPLPS